MQVVSTGDKIKKLRIDVGLNQEDLTNDEITRSLISMIENNKRSLTYKTAQVIAASLNQYYHNLGREITADYLLETDEAQAQRLVKEMLKDMQGILKNPVPGNEVAVEQSFQRLIQFSKDWGLDSVIAELLEIRGNYYFDTYQYSDALKDLLAAQEYYLQQGNYEKAAYVYNVIGMTHYHLMLFDQALLYYEMAEKTVRGYASEHREKLLMYVTYNRILSYRRLHQYDLALKEIYTFKNLNYHDPGYYYEVLLVEANTYRDLHNYEKADKIYQRLLKKENKLPSNSMFLVYENVARLHYSQGDLGRSFEAIQAALAYQEQAKPQYVVSLMNIEAKVYFAEGNYDAAIKAIDRATTLAEKINRIELTLQLQFLLVDIYLELKQYSLVEKSLDSIYRLIKNRKMKEQLIRLNAYYIMLYTLTKNHDRLLKYSQELVIITGSN